MNILYPHSTSGSVKELASYKDTLILPAWVQGRVSTKQQVNEKVMKNGNVFFEEKASIEEQKKKCIEAILNYKGNCPNCYKDIRLSFIGESFAKGESGRSKNRVDIDEILDKASDGVFKVLVTNDNDRLARKRSTAIIVRDRLKENGIQIYSLSQPVPIKCPDCYDPMDDDTGTIVETLSDMKSQLDLSKIRRNYKIGMPKRIRSGKISGCTPYGLYKTYKKAGKDNMGNDLLEEVYKWDKEKIAVIKRIADEYLLGKGIWGICKGLNADEIPTAMNKSWGEDFSCGYIEKSSICWESKVRCTTR